MKKYIILILLMLSVFIFCCNTNMADNSTNQNVNMENSALLVVDVQNAVFPILNEDTFLKNVKKLIEKAEKSNKPIIYVQHTNNADYREGSDGWQIKEEIRPEGEYLSITKKYGSSFKETNLKELLASLKVDTLVICGLASQFCVNATIVDAINMEYTVIAASDAHSMPAKYDESIIEKMNQIWKELGVIVKSTDSINF